ncbi:LamG-like jellyroll fold domain-containing protein, partial [Verrucomicrobiota bacterium]
MSFWIKTANPDARSWNYPVTLTVDGQAGLVAVRTGGNSAGPAGPAGSISVGDWSSGFNCTATDSNRFTTAQDGNVWRHIAVTYDNNDSPRTRIYKDGVELPISLDNRSGPVTDQNRVVLGCLGTTGWPTYGLLDEVAVFDRSLTGSEVLNLYRGSSLRFRVRSAAVLPLSGDFVGPDGTSNTWYHADHEALVSGGNFSTTNARYAQYRVNLFSDFSLSKTPYLESVGLFSTQGVQYDSTVVDYKAGTNWYNVTNHPAAGTEQYVGMAGKDNGGYFTNGYYESRVIDGGHVSVQWRSMTWTLGQEWGNDADGLIGLYHMDTFWIDEATMPGQMGDNSGNFANIAWSTVNAKLGQTAGTFDGASSHAWGLGFGTTSVLSIAFWINNENLNDGIMDLASGKYICITNRTVTAEGFEGNRPAIYVNGGAASRKLGPGWNHVALVWPSVIDASGMDVGVADGDYMEGLLDELAVFNSELTAAEIKAHYIGARPGTAGEVQIQIRTGNSTGELAAASWWPPGGSINPGQLFFETGRYFQYRASLQGDGDAMPAFGGISISGEDEFLSPFSISDDTWELCLQGTFVNGQTRWYGENIMLDNLSATEPAEIAEAGIAGVWHLDEGFWGPVKDSSPMSRDGWAFAGAAPSAPGKVGLRCGYFDGVDDYVVLGFVNEL